MDEVLRPLLGYVCPIAYIPSGHLIIKVKGWAIMVISSRTVGDIIVIDLDGNYSRDLRPSPDLGEQVKAALATGVKKFLAR
jgi:hypothetical protein